MDEQEILDRFKRQQSTRRTRFPELTGTPGLPSSSIKDETNQDMVAPAPLHKTGDKVSRKRAMKLSRKSVMFVMLGVGVLGIVGGAVAISKWQQHTKAAKATLLAQASPTGISIALYYPHNLPAGFTYNNDSRTLKTDVLYYSVKGSKNDMYYITQQPIPASFDFVAFNKKFATPDNFSTGAGTVTAGAVGPTILGSIRTDKNTWIIINSSPEATLANLETVARSFELKN